jgi:hypothetical protein
MSEGLREGWGMAGQERARKRGRREQQQKDRDRDTKKDSYEIQKKTSTMSRLSQSRQSTPSLAPTHARLYLRPDPKAQCEDPVRPEPVPHPHHPHARPGPARGAGVEHGRGATQQRGG